MTEKELIVREVLKLEAAALAEGKLEQLGAALLKTEHKHREDQACATPTGLGEGMSEFLGGEDVRPTEPASLAQPAPQMGSRPPSREGRRRAPASAKNSREQGRANRGGLSQSVRRRRPSSSRAATTQDRKQANSLEPLEPSSPSSTASIRRGAIGDPFAQLSAAATVPVVAPGSSPLETVPIWDWPAEPQKTGKEKTSKENKPKAAKLSKRRRKRENDPTDLGTDLPAPLHDSDPFAGLGHDDGSVGLESPAHASAKRRKSLHRKTESLMTGATARSGGRPGLARLPSKVHLARLPLMQQTVFTHVLFYLG
jgi:hypothetical protein